MTGWTDAQQSHVHEKRFLCIPVVRRMLTCCILVVTCWERSDLLALLYVMFLSHSQITHLTQDIIWGTFPYGVLCQVWYLIVWIPDRCLCYYFNLMYTYAKFDQNIPCGSRVTQWAFSLEQDRTKWCLQHIVTFLHTFHWLTTDWRTDGVTDGLTYWLLYRPKGRVTHNRRNYLFFRA